MEAINYLIAYHDESNHYLQVMLMKYQASFEWLELEVEKIGVAAPMAISNDKPAMEAQEAEADANEEKVEIVGGEPEPPISFDVTQRIRDPEPEEIVQKVDETEEQVFKQEVAPDKEDVEEKVDVMASFMLQAAQ